VISFRSAGSCLEVRYGKVFVCGRNMVPGEALLERCGWLENPCQERQAMLFVAQLGIHDTHNLLGKHNHFKYLCEEDRKF
jgi:hypothetical protein